MALDAERRFAAVGLKRTIWANADPIRKIFRRAFAAAVQPSFNPHSFRITLARLGERICRTPEEFKAWSQNLGHEQPSTTFLNYGEVETYRQGEIMRSFPAAEQARAPTTEERLARIEALLSHESVAS